jgi:hypothetical protein
VIRSEVWVMPAPEEQVLVEVAGQYRPMRCTARGPRHPLPRGSSAWVPGVVGWRAWLHYDGRRSGAGCAVRAGARSERSGLVQGAGRGSLFRPEEEGRTIGHDARLTLWVPARGTASQKMCSDLGFSEACSVRHVSDDASCGVRGDPPTGREGLLTCGFVRAH